MGIDLMASRRRIITNSPHLASATPANPVAFSATIAAPLKGLECAFSPVQAAGTPAPDNVLPISGWTNCNVWRTGTNIWDEQWELGTISTTTGQNSSSTVQIRSKNYIPVAPNTTYCQRNGGLRSVWMAVLAYDADKSFITNLGGLNNTQTFTTPSNCAYVRFYVATTYGTTYNNDISINYPATDTEYHPYTGQTLAVAFPAEAGTIYGGYVDPVRGVARAEWGAVDLGSLTWDIYKDLTSGFSFFYTPLSNGAVNVTGGREAYCSSYKRYDPSGGNWWTHVPDKQFVSQASGVTSAVRVWIRDDTYSDKSTFKTAVSGVMLVYKLATPIEYPLTPAQLKTLKGANVIYTDLNGNVSPTFWTH